MGQRSRSDADIRQSEGRTHSPLLSPGEEGLQAFKLKSIPVQSLANLVCDLFQVGWRYSRNKASLIDT